MLDIKQMKVALEILETEKRIPKEKIIDAIEQSLAAAYKKDYGEKGQIVRCHLDMDTGAMHFEQVKIVADESTVRMPKFDAEGTEIKEEIELDAEGKPVDARTRYNEEHHILLSEARLMKKDTVVGDEMVFPLELRDDFGRIAAQTAKQVVMQRLREAERESVVQEFGGKEGSIVSGTIQRIERGIVYVDLGRATAVLPMDEQIKNERYFPGMRLRAYLYSLDEGSRSGFSMRLSRTHPKFLVELFKQESPEVANGIVEIKSIAREPGSRSKIAVYTADESIDPIGSCVGQRGSRVNTVSAELGGEKIDLIEWSSTPEQFVADALSPAEIESIELNEEEKKATVYVTEGEQSLAIGKGGQNVRLAAKLTGWKIDIVSVDAGESVQTETEEAEDVVSDKEEFIEELEAPVVEETSDSASEAVSSDSGASSSDTN
jgi:N utilization substance protein A